MTDTAVLLFLETGTPEEDTTGWPFERVAGLSIVERNLMTLRQLGVQSALLVGGQDLLALMESFIQERKDDPRLPAVTVQGVGGPDLTLPGRHLILDGRRLFHAKALQAALAQENEASFSQPDGSPAGLAVRSHACPLDRQAFEHQTRIPLPAGSFSAAADTSKRRKAAGTLIFRSLIKATDGPISVYLNRPVSLSISRLLVRFPIHPNVVTVFTFLVGIASGALSALGTHLGFALGGILYHLASILDGVDGEIARVKFLGSRTGQWMDTICDDMTNAIYIGGVTIGVWASMGSRLLLGLGIAAVALDVVTVALLYWQLVVKFHGGTLLDVEWNIKKPGARKSPLVRFLVLLEPLIKRDGYALVFMVLGIANVAWVVLPVSCTGIGTMLVLFLIQLAKKTG